MPTGAHPHGTWDWTAAATGLRREKIAALAGGSAGRGMWRGQRRVTTRQVTDAVSRPQLMDADARTLALADFTSSAPLHSRSRPASGNPYASSLLARHPNPGHE
ncbi:hypothetical protein ADK86_02200 [Streptomyces sp. NRRL F-5755]|nr:hypothetical protein ADK86_02200 [Streptomyces sp. NRRL F-5755]